MRAELLVLSCCLFGVVSLLVGCGKPYVGHSSIDGSVREVQSWRIEYERGPMQEAAYQQFIEVEPGTKYKYTDTAEAFLDEVRKSLRKHHDLPTASNFPAYGTIKVRLYGSATSEFKPVDTTTMPRYLLEEVAPDPTYDPQHEFSAISPGAPNLAALGRDRIYKAHIIVYNHLGQLAGEIFVGKNPDDNIEPEFLAEVIAKVIQEGRY